MNAEVVLMLQQAMDMRGGTPPPLQAVDVDTLSEALVPKRVVKLNKK